MRKNSSGQSLVEALFTVVFTTVIMFSFLQVCIIVVDDMSANEAAFTAMRSAAVTKSSKREEEAYERVRNYLFLFYPLSNIKSIFTPSNLVYSDKNTVRNYFGRNRDSENSDEDYETTEGYNEEDKSVTLERNDRNRPAYNDFSGMVIDAYTVKFYYFTRVMFGSLVAKLNSKKDIIFGGARRYQSSRNRMVTSPDEEFYYKAYPEAKEFYEK
ncbi:MAG: hypothetical protein LBD46_04025 [Endomicrobium sp.]|jgi:hypothetical protein|nr:hypothetical protein [Endomicrobium sp.]